MFALLCVLVFST